MVLAIGIGVNVSAFSLFDMVALKPLPVPDPESLVRLERRSPEITSSEMPYPSVVFYRDHAKTLSAVMAVMGVPPMEIENDLQPAHASFRDGQLFHRAGNTYPPWAESLTPRGTMLQAPLPSWCSVMSFGYGASAAIHRSSEARSI